MPPGSPKQDRISHRGGVIEYEIVHRPAVTRRIHLELDEGGRLRVVAPRRMSRRAVRRLLQERAHRVDRFLVDARRRARDLPELHYRDGERHLYLGRRYPLRLEVSPGRRRAVSLDEAFIRVSAPEQDPGRMRQQLLRWYRSRAQEVFEQRLDKIARAAPWAGQAPPLRLRRMKRTWGNCSAAGVITLNTHLVKAPMELIDYVIAHEVCHLREHNHGKAFYALQQKLFPNWREARARIKAEGHAYLHF